MTTLKKHLFFERHEYPIATTDGPKVVRGRFEADDEIAYAWKTAQNQELTDAQKAWFRQLANHELAEHTFMGQGIPYRTLESYDLKSKYLNQCLLEPMIWPPILPDGGTSPVFNKIIRRICAE